MEDKIEVGEYVRVNNDNRNCIGIGQVTRLVNESVYVNMNNKYNLPVYFQINNIVKHRKQLIDLIEVGDIVNGMEILHIEDNKLYVEWNNEFEEFTGFLENKDIKTILTKESYMDNCYKVGGEDDGKGTNNK